MNPYLIPPHSVVSFSGGRTSGYMLRQILDAFGGELPPDRHVVFANTGKERDETLDFVQECSVRWNVRITWLEFDLEAEHKTAIVSHNSASRNGEPLAAIIRSRKFLPNVGIRFCTIEGKVKRIQAYARYMLGYSAWTSVVGLRADEMHRVNRQRARAASGKDGKGVGVPCMPLADAGITKRDVKAFWDASPFDLRLENINGTTPWGNCDLCFLKKKQTLRALIRQEPSRAKWWLDQEEWGDSIREEGIAGPRFLAGYQSYRQLVDQAINQGDLFSAPPDEEESVDCACTD